jgi:hypothetical protein
MTMTPEHPRWDEFYKRLEGPEGCNFVKLEDGQTAWHCAGAGPNRYVLASAVLWEMGFTMADIRASFAFFAAHGGHCDCEILFNLDGGAFES